MFHPRLLLAAALAASLACTPAFAAGSRPAVNHATLIVALDKEIQSLDAQVTTSGDSQRYAMQIYDTLYGFDAEGKVVPRMAHDYRISNEGRTYTFHLRDGITFHDGSPFTSQDVKFSIERIIDPATKSTRRLYFEPFIKRIETPDPGTVVIHLNKADGVFLNKIAGFLFIVPARYTASLPSPEAFASAPVGSGPYRVREHRIGQFLELERFDGFYGARPAIQRLVLRYVPDPSSRVNAILTGEVDIATLIPLADVERLRRQKGLKVITNPVAAPMHVRLYSNRPDSPLAKREVRLALNHALDVPAIIQGVFHGVGEPMGTFISRHFPYGADPSIPLYGYDPQKAKALLAEAGYPNGFDTTLNDVVGYPKEFAEAIVAYWAQVGVRARINRLDFAAWTRLNNTHQTGPMTTSQFTNAIYDPIHPVAGSFSRDGTWSDYEHPQVEALLRQLDTATGAAQRGALFRQIGRILHEDAAAVLVTELFNVFVTKDAIDWQVQQGSGFLNFRNVEWREE